ANTIQCNDDGSGTYQDRAFIETNPGGPGPLPSVNRYEVVASYHYLVTSDLWGLWYNSGNNNHTCVSPVTRQVLYLPTPDYFVGHDRVTLGQTTFTGQQQWHCSTTATVTTSGNTWKVTAPSGTGRLFAATFSNQTITTSTNTPSLSAGTITQIVTKPSGVTG